jgi:putative redox protein
VDEPVPIGEGRGPDPYDLLLGAIGTCTAMTARLYARTKGWPLEHIQVRLRHERSHGADCATGGRCERVFRTVALEGPLEPEQEARLRDVVRRCPVVRSLASGIEIVDE